MLNYIWSGMILIGILVASFTGKMPDVTNAAINSSKEAVSLCVTMLGIMSMWTGLMKIAEKAGAIDTLAGKMTGLMNFLFPGVPKDNLARKYIATNFIANALGLGWAATPAGLKAMVELQKLNHDRKTASVDMCTFMIINMSSLQIVSVNIIAYRAQTGSVNPSEIIGPGLLATLVSTIASIIYAKAMQMGERRKKKYPIPGVGYGIRGSSGGIGS